MQELTIKELLKILQKRWWQIAIFGILVTLAAGYYYQRQPDEYVAQAKLLVQLIYEDSMGQKRYDPSTSEQFAGDFPEMISKPDIMEMSLKRMNLKEGEFSPFWFDIKALSGSRILHLSVTGYDPELCMNAANIISQVFIEYISENMPEIIVKVSAKAKLPTAPAGPARTKNTLMVGIVGFLLAIGAALAIDILNTTLRTADAVENALGLPVLAGIQNYKKDLKWFLKKHQPGEMLSKGISTLTAEDIKTLVTNIQFSTIARPAKTILITSSIADEGKSSLLLMLAEVFADFDKHVLVVDMDIRNPSIGQYLGTRCRYDLFDYMIGHCRMDDIICKTGNPNLHFIDSRHSLASVSQIVNYEVFNQFLENAKRLYDLILFDTPPLGLFIDAAALANKMDASLLVVGCGMADSSTVRDVVDQLHKANANILGAALNFVDHPKSHRQYYGKKHVTKADKKESHAAFKKSVQKA